MGGRRTVFCFQFLFFFNFLWEKKMNSKGVVFLGYFQRGFLGNFAKVFFFEKI